MPTAWRIFKTVYAKTAFDGEGARLFGGRWNSPGTRMVYAAGSASLALVEVLVHLEDAGPLPAFSLCSAGFDDGIVRKLQDSELPDDWNVLPYPASTQALGDLWVRDLQSAVLEVPSAVVPGESNYLINPAHEDFASLKLGEPRPYELDPRLLP